ncbi:MAG: ThiF family adenylyltransferase, partial [Candidatus Binatia bacterium]
IRLLATEALTPPPDAWECQETAMLRPSARFVSAAVSRAITSGAGLMFVHSHPDPRFPVELSQVDLSSFQSLAATLAPMLDGPFAAAVVHPHGWAGVIWQDSQVTAIDRILEIGRTIRFLSPISYMNTSPLDDRQADALGIVHDIVRKLSVGVVGVGGLGSPIAEQLFRMGVDELFVIDHDLLDTESNVRRDFGAKLSDLGKNKLKVDVVGDHLDEIGLGVKVRRIAGDVREEEVFRHLLDADVVLNATDTHGSRAIVNELASTYLLPVIDVGVRVGAKSDNRLSALVAEVRVLTSSTPCLWCRGTISPEVIRAENLPYEEREQLEGEGYVVQGVGDPVPSVVALTVLGSGLATTALLSLLSEEGDVAPSGYIVDGFLGDSLVIGPGEPKADCRCHRQLGLGDSSPPPFVLIR